ncbi:MAG: hypothetical protein AB9861_00575 [Methanosarcina sp.]
MRCKRGKSVNITGKPEFIFRISLQSRPPLKYCIRGKNEIINCVGISIPEYQANYPGIRLDGYRLHGLGIIYGEDAV